MNKFNCSKRDFALCAKIAQRAVAMAARFDGEYSKQDAVMDVVACHCNGNPLDLNRLLTADDFNFSHDVFGIRRHLNHDTRALENCFVPRFSTKYTLAA